jgi:hypothetical protein
MTYQFALLPKQKNRFFENNIKFDRKRNTYLQIKLLVLKAIKSWKEYIKESK